MVVVLMTESVAASTIGLAVCELMNFDPQQSGSVVRRVRL